MTSLNGYEDDPNYKDARCSICLGGFTRASWDARHTSRDGEDCHARCCDTPECRAERAYEAALKRDAARASEMFGDDELERWAACQEEAARLQAVVDGQLAPIYDATDETIIGYMPREWVDL